LKILLVNDDGILAPGIRALAEELKNAGHKITIVAPDSERSAASHSLSIRKELIVKKSLKMNMLSAEHLLIVLLLRYKKSLPNRWI